MHSHFQEARPARATVTSGRWRRDRIFSISTEEIIGQWPIALDRILHRTYSDILNATVGLGQEAQSVDGSRRGVMWRIKRFVVRPRGP